MHVGGQYTMVLRQKAAHGKDPHVVAEFPHDVGGRVKSEDAGADGHNYITIRRAGFDGLWIFRIDGGQSPVNGSPRVLATLFLVV